MILTVRRDVLLPGVRFLQVDDLGRGGPLELARRGPEDRVGGARRRPDLLERQQVAVQERPDGLGVTERGRPAHREARGGPGLLRVGTLCRGGARKGRQAADVDPVRPARERQHGLALRDEHERLHDLPNLAPDRPSRVGGGLRSLGEPSDIDRVPEHGGGVEEPLDRLAHEANDTGRMSAGTIRPARRRADLDRPRSRGPADGHSRPGRGSEQVTLDRTQLLGIAHAERERLGRTIQYTSPDAWDAPSVCQGWRNRDIVAHLAAQDAAAAQLLAGEPAAEFDAFREANDGELWVNGFNEWAVEVRKDVPTRQLITDWGRAAKVFLVLCSGPTDDEWASKKLEWVAGEIGLRYLVQSRTIEWWFHQEDIREGAGLEGNPQHDPVYLTNDMAIRMLPWALGQAGLSFPGRSVQVDLEGVGGGTWHWGLEPRTTPPADKKPDAFINGRGTAFALVAGRRVAAESYLDDGDLVVGGDEALAIVVLELLRAFVE